MVLPVPGVQLVNHLVLSQPIPVNPNRGWMSCLSDADWRHSRLPRPRFRQPEFRRVCCPIRQESKGCARCHPPKPKRMATQIGQALTEERKALHGMVVRMKPERSPKAKRLILLLLLLPLFFLFAFSAQKSHVKPPNHLTLYQPTTSEWRISSAPTAILDI